jgi:hypothetical protein
MFDLFGKRKSLKEIMNELDEMIGSFNQMKNLKVMKVLIKTVDGKPKRIHLQTECLGT